MHYFVEMEHLPQLVYIYNKQTDIEVKISSALNHIHMQVFKMVAFYTSKRG